MDEATKVFVVILGALVFFALMTPMLGFWNSVGVWFLIALVTIIPAHGHSVYLSLKGN